MHSDDYAPRTTFGAGSPVKPLYSGAYTGTYGANTTRDYTHFNDYTAGY